MAQRVTWGGRDDIRSPSLRGSLAPNSVPITAIDRAYFSRTIRDSTDLSTTSTTFGELDSDNLAVTVASSGRPMFLGLTCICGNSTNYLTLAFEVDGKRVSDDGSTTSGRMSFVSGLGSADGSISCLIGAGSGSIPRLSPGSHRIAVVGMVGGGTGTVYVSGDNTLSFWGFEI